MTGDGGQAAGAPGGIRAWLAGLTAQRLRLASGLVLFAFVLTHFLNHALGIVSLEAMEAVQRVRAGFWQSPPGLVLLCGAALIHIGLALGKTARRRTLAMPFWEAAQLLLGLAIPFLIAGHVVGTFVSRLRFDAPDEYSSLLGSIWASTAVLQSLAMLVVWTHAMIGLHYWLRGRVWYQRSLPALFAFAVALPLATEWGWTDAARRLPPGPAPERARLGAGFVEWNEHSAFAVRAGFAVLLAGVALAIAARRRDPTGWRSIAVTFPGGRVVRVVPGATLLEIAREREIPIASVCGGRARCSTCRTRILSGFEALPPPSDAEAAVLARVHASHGVRLACQIRPASDLSVEPLLPVAAGWDGGAQVEDAFHWGVEQTVAILFVDMRGFTSLSENRLSFDVVFLLNRYLDAMAREVREAGGQVDKFIGDGVMAIFGIGQGVQAGSRAALVAAAGMGRALVELNREFEASLGQPLRIGVGIHAGPVILGRVGEAGGRDAASITALGDTVNTASRLETMTKTCGGVVVASAAVVRAAGVDATGIETVEAPVRGRRSQMRVCVFKEFAALEQALAATEPGRDRAGSA